VDGDPRDPEHLAKLDGFEHALIGVKQGYPLEFDLTVEEDADWAVYRRMPGRGGA
jgi:hypothetical protein